MNIHELDQAQQTALEAAAFRQLVNHLQNQPEVQNIDLMNLAGFCRNCLSKWYVAAAAERGISIDYESARENIYGIPYAVWKEKYQCPANAEQLNRFEEAKHKSKHA